MKANRKLTIASLALMMAGAALAASDGGKISCPKFDVTRAGDKIMVDASICLDSLRVGSNRQYFITPVIEDADGNSEKLASILVNGRNMHYAWERGTLCKSFRQGHNVKTEVRRLNGKPQTVDYSASAPLEPWMWGLTARMTLVMDTCGCGDSRGSGRVLEPAALGLMPQFEVAYVNPEVTELPVSIHEGEARVQFEVDKTELHAEPYRCKSGQRIDNRAQLKVIDDSVRYALSDPLVEIARIKVVGYASPESPYVHNEELATARSRSLAEYLAKRYNLPRDRSEYDAVPENWAEFRQQVLASREISEQQRRDLLALIDRPAYGPSDYDAKERELKTDPKFATLYKTKILPEWFPRLRATKFEIQTRLHPMTDEQLAEVMKTNPRMMSLNQMFRVARLYPQGSPEFIATLRKALEVYPDDPVANLNVAAALIADGNDAEAVPYLRKAGNSAEAENLRGIVEAHKVDFEGARKHFEAAQPLTEATLNLKKIK